MDRRMYPNANAGVGMDGLEIPLHQSHHPQIQLRQQMMSMNQPTNYNSYNNSNVTLNPNQNPNPGVNSEENEMNCQNDHENTTIDGNRNGDSNSKSPWQRMKWTDHMVTSLILAVYFIGDKTGNEKKKSGSGCGGGMLQKKGKWKWVSSAMMEKGFNANSQQCEDKFNDMNKRYKRMIEILGKGTACKVVENPALLETMNLSPKLKDEVWKMLNSKHLFFREMCTYHNRCGHGATANDGTQNAASVTDVQHDPQSMSHQLRQFCWTAPSPTEHNGMHKLEHVGGDEEDEDEHEDNDDEHDEGGRPRKRARTVGEMQSFSQALQDFNGEMMGVLQDGDKSPREKKLWLKTRLVQLEDQELEYQCKAWNLEKFRLQWVKLSSDKESEINMMKLESERKRVETKRMVRMLKQKEIELIDEPNPSAATS